MSPHPVPRNSLHTRDVERKDGFLTSGVRLTDVEDYEVHEAHDRPLTACQGLPDQTNSTHASL